MWIQLVFGFYAWITLFILRYWRLYVVVRGREALMTASKLAIAFLVLWLPTLIYAIFASIFKVTGPSYVDQVYMCDFQDVPMYIIFAYVFLFVVIVIVSPAPPNFPRSPPFPFQSPLPNMSPRLSCFAIHLLDFFLSSSSPLS